MVKQTVANFVIFLYNSDNHSTLEEAMDVGNYSEIEITPERLKNWTFIKHCIECGSMEYSTGVQVEIHYDSKCIYDECDSQNLPSDLEKLIPENDKGQDMLDRLKKFKETSEVRLKSLKEDLSKPSEDLVLLEHKLNDHKTSVYLVEMWTQVLYTFEKSDEPVDVVIKHVINDLLWQMAHYGTVKNMNTNQYHRAKAIHDILLTLNRFDNIS